MRRTPFKAKARKKRAWHDKAALDSCKGMECFLAIPGICRGDLETVVPAHRNEGKGMGIKTPDKLTVPACYDCHFEYDQGSTLPRHRKRELWDDAYERWSAYRDA